MADKIRTTWDRFIVPAVILDTDVSTKAKLVYICLCRFADSKGSSFPSVATITKQTGVARRFVYQTFTELKSFGLLSITCRFRENGGKTSNLYTIHEVALLREKTDTDVHTGERGYVPTGEHPHVPTGEHELDPSELKPSEQSTVAVAPVLAQPKVSATDPLYGFIQAAFVEKHGPFSNWGKEGKSIHWLIKKARLLNPDHPEELIAEIVTEFWELKRSGGRFWQEQPFTPSVLNGLFDRVHEHLRNQESFDDFEEAARQ